MHHIYCPYCEEMREEEGEAHIERPLEPDQLTDEEWAEYIFMRTNPKGVFLERWVHQSGCRRWFNLARNTATNDCNYWLYIKWVRNHPLAQLLINKKQPKFLIKNPKESDNGST